MANILVIDDDTRLRDLLAQYLAGEGYKVTTAKDANDARKSLKQKNFDLLVVDVMMPGEDGLQLTTSLREDSDIPILMLTAMSEPEDRIKGLEVGANDYLTKPFEPRELCLRIENILKRKKTRAEKSNIRFGDFKFNMNNGELYKNDEFIHLTSSELKLLIFFSGRIDIPVSREELTRLFNGISERSVDVQVTRLRKKLEENPKKPRYLQTYRGEGYILRSVG